MAWLPIYASEQDVAEILAHLNEAEELAFVVSNGPGKWKAVPSISSLQPGRYCLWHLPSGSLPLFKGSDIHPGEVENPFEGWAEVKAGANPSTPYFGAGHPGIIWLNIRLNGTCTLTGATTIGLSSFEWIGNHYRSIGASATAETEKFWKALGRWVKKHSVKVSRGGPQQPTPPEIWAFAGAQAMFENGAKGGNV